MTAMNDIGDCIHVSCKVDKLTANRNAWWMESVVDGDLFTALPVESSAMRALSNFVQTKFGDSILGDTGPRKITSARLQQPKIAGEGRWCIPFIVEYEYSTDERDRHEWIEYQNDIQVRY